MSKKDIKNETEIMEAAAIAEVSERIAVNEKLTSNQSYDQIMKEKQALIAEAYKLVGRREAFDFISKTANVGSLMIFKNVKENKLYRDMNIDTWEKYCKLSGVSRQKIDLDLENLETFGEDFIANVSSFGLSYRDLRKLSKLKDSGSIAIENDQFVIEGEAIASDDKDALKNALEQLIEAKEDQIKLLGEKSKTLEDTVNSKERIIAETNERLEKEFISNDRLKEKLQSFKSVELEGIDTEELPHVNLMQEAQVQFNKIFLNLRRLATDETMSEFSKRMLGGLVAHIICQTDDVRLELNKKSKHYYPEVRLSAGDIDTLEELTDDPIEMIRQKRAEANSKTKKK